MKNKLAAVGLAAGLLGGAAAGLALGVPGLAGAQSDATHHDDTGHDCSGHECSVHTPSRAATRPRPPRTVRRG